LRDDQRLGYSAERAEAKLSDVVERRRVNNFSLFSSHSLLRTKRCVLTSTLAQYNVPLFINDRVDIALALKANLHVGQSDLPAKLARQLLGPDALIGVSVNTPEEMQIVLDEGVADYVGVGPCFGTQTKKNLNPIMGPRGVRDILQVLGDSEVKAVVIGTSTAPFACCFFRCVAKPSLLLVRTGGITPSTIPNVLRQTPAPLPSGAYRALDGLAVVSSIAASTDPETASRELKKLFDERIVYPTRSLDAEQGLSEKDVVEIAAQLVALLRERSKKPLVHHITNQVVMNECVFPSPLSPAASLSLLSSASQLRQSHARLFRFAHHVRLARRSPSPRQTHLLSPPQPRYDHGTPNQCSEDRWSGRKSGKEAGRVRSGRCRSDGVQKEECEWCVSFLSFLLRGDSTT
jgi:thiamine monophosphate synthase